MDWNSLIHSMPVVLVSAILSALISGGILMLNQALERKARREDQAIERKSRREEMLFNASKDLALERHRTEREKLQVMMPFILYISNEYSELKHILENDGAMSEQAISNLESSLKDPIAIAAMKKEGWKVDEIVPKLRAKR
jgi:hypothetical protein